MIARTTLLASLSVGLAALVACTGGAGPYDPMDLGYEAPPISGDRPRTSITEDPNGGQQGSSSDGQGSSGSSGSSGSNTPKSACPPCGGYTCTGTSAALPFSKQPDGSCGIPGSLVLDCAGKILDGKGNVIGSWSGSGSTVTLSPASGATTTCTVGGSSQPAPAPTPEPAPAPQLDGGF